MVPRLRVVRFEQHVVGDVVGAAGPALDVGPAAQPGVGLQDEVGIDRLPPQAPPGGQAQDHEGDGEGRQGKPVPRQPRLHRDSAGGARR